LSTKWGWGGGAHVHALPTESSRQRLSKFRCPAKQGAVVVFCPRVCYTLDKTHTPFLSRGVNSFCLANRDFRVPIFRAWVSWERPVLEAREDTSRVLSHKLCLLREAFNYP
ncbi:unnamed protein product, partial [Ectocarpus sp. 13 AM-2016]